MKKKTKIFVLDTSVLIHDHHAIINFKQHDVAIPITVLEELDKFKSGNDTKNFSAREVIRFIDKLVGNERLSNWIDIEKTLGKFKIIMDNDPKTLNAEKVYASSKNDHKIINAALILQEEFPTRNVILVTKDINLRIKAKALGVAAEDYETGKVYELKNELAPDYIIDHVDSDLIREVFTRGTCEEQGVLGELKRTNGYYILKNGKTSSLVYYNQTSGMLERIEKEFVYGIKPKNAEQAFALHALTNPDIKLVALQGVAGTGKTLLALAAALEQEKKFNQIILARPIVPLSNKEIGFLPGDANDKISPYMEPLWDNLKFIKAQYGEHEKKHKAISEMEENKKIVITPLAFIRGRSFSNIMFIIDEAQNLTPKQMKTLITRAGPGTKVICLGNIAQIDTPYLTEGSSGLTFVVDRFKGWPHAGSVTLQRGERSRLADYAGEVL